MEAAWPSTVTPSSERTTAVSSVPPLWAAVLWRGALWVGAGDWLSPVSLPVQAAQENSIASASAAGIHLFRIIKVPFCFQSGNSIAVEAETNLKFR